MTDRDPTQLRSGQVPIWWVWWLSAKLPASVADAHPGEDFSQMALVEYDELDRLVLQKTESLPVAQNRVCN